MTSRENAVIIGSALATVGGLGLLVLIELTVGFPGEWAAVLAFLVIAVLGFILPQLYLTRVDDATSRVSRMGVITLMLFLLASMFSRSVSGAELTILWSIVGISVALIAIYETREGYLASR